MPSTKVLELKEKGNEGLKNGNYAEAIIHYTYALKLDPSCYQLYSNRSLAFLKLQQYYHALEDAKKTIEWKPDWAKGYYRKGEIEFQTEHYAEAIESYRKALQLEDDPSLIEAMRKAKREFLRVQKSDDQLPWIGAGVGFIIGAILIAVDSILKDQPYLQFQLKDFSKARLNVTKNRSLLNPKHLEKLTFLSSLSYDVLKSTSMLKVKKISKDIQHPFLKVLVVIISVCICYEVTKYHRHYLHQYRKSLLDPPLDLFGDLGNDMRTKEEEEIIKDQTTNHATNRKRNPKSNR